MLQIGSRSDGGKYLKSRGAAAWNIGEDVFTYIYIVFNIIFLGVLRCTYIFI